MNKSIIILVVTAALHNGVMASTLNPCEYMNLNAEQAHKLDVGDDPNFKQIVQHKNQELVRACLDYEIKLAETMRNDLNRDNY